MLKIVSFQLARIAGRLSMARELAGLTQLAAADRLGIHRPTLSMIERGRQKLTVELLLKMAVVYRKSVSELIGEHDPADAQ